MLALPWELLATEQGFFAAEVRIFEVARQVGRNIQTPVGAKYSDLTLAFMAADPGLTSQLNYEVEEAAIFQITKNHNNMNLIVDESGNLQQLSTHLHEIGHCDMLHLSCHGELDQQNNFTLKLEDQLFQLAPASAMDFEPLSQQLNTLFLSACHSGSLRGSQSFITELRPKPMAHGRISQEA